MDDYIDRDNVEKMIMDFYKVANISPPRNLTINDQVAKVFLKILSETQKCSKAFILVPHPPLGAATVKWLAYNLPRTVFENASGKISITCAKRVLYNLGSQLRIAGI